MPTALITGASRGIGLEFVRQYAADGCRVVAACRTPVSATDLAGVVRASDGRVTVHALDVEDHASIDRLAAELSATPIDVLVNNAGSAGAASTAVGGRSAQGFGQSSYDDWLTMFRVNVMAPMKMAEAFAAHLDAGQGKSIAMLSSVLGSIAQNAMGGIYPYRATKSGVNAVTKSLSVDLAGRGIKVVASHPGWVQTDMGGPHATLDAATSVRGMRAVIAGLTPEQSGRFLLYDGSGLPW